MKRFTRNLANATDTMQDHKVSVAGVSQIPSLGAPDPLLRVKAAMNKCRDPVHGWFKIWPQGPVSAKSKLTRRSEHRG
jgi:hypothetical protein